MIILQALKSELKQHEQEISQLFVDSEKLLKFSLSTQVNFINSTYKQLRLNITSKIENLNEFINIHERFYYYIVIIILTLLFEF